MWFKRASFGYCAASLVVTIVTASNTKDAPMLKRQHMVERLVFPLLERRQQSIGNQTSASEPIESTSSIQVTSSVIAPSEELQTSTILSTPSIATTHESTPVAAPTPTPASSAQEPNSSSFKFSSSSGEILFTSTISGTESSTLSSASYASEQQPSRTSTLPRPTSSQDVTSERVTSFTFADVTSIASSSAAASSSVDELPSSNAMDVPLSITRSNFNQAPTATSEIVSSADITLAPSPTSATIGSNIITSMSGQTSTASSESTFHSDGSQISATTSIPTLAESVSQVVSDTTPSSASDSAILISQITASSSFVRSLTTQISAPGTSNLVISNPNFPTSESIAATTTHIEQQPTVSPTIARRPTTDPVSNSAISESSTSSILAVFTSLPQESQTTSSNRRAPPSASLTAIWSPIGQASSSSEQATSSSPMPQPITAVAPSSDGISFSTQTVATEAIPSSPVPSDSTGSSTSTIESATSVIETSKSSSVPSSLETAAAPTSSTLQLPLSSSGDQSFSSRLPEPTPAVSVVSSTIGPTIAPSNQPSIIASSSQSMVTLSGEGVPSSSLPEPSLVVSEVLTTPGPSVSSPSPPVAPTSTLQTETSMFAAPMPTSIIISTQTVLSNTMIPTAPASDVVSTSSESLAPPSTLVVTPSSTVIEGVPSISTPSGTVPVGSSNSARIPGFSIETSVSSGATSGSEIFSSFMPSETQSTGAVDATTSSSQMSFDLPQISSSHTSTFIGTQPSFSEPLPSVTSNLQQSTSGVVSASESQATQSRVSSSGAPALTGISSLPTPSSLPSFSSSFSSESQVQGPTSVFTTSMNTTASGPIPTSESSHSTRFTKTSEPGALAASTPSGISSFASGVSSSLSSNRMPLSSSIVLNATQTVSLAPVTSGTVTTTFSTVYISSFRSSVLDPSTVVLSLFNTVTGAAINQSEIRTSSAQPATSGTQVPASESLIPSSRLGSGTNFTWSLPAQPSSTAMTDSSSRFNGTTSSTTNIGISFSRSALPTGVITGTASSVNATQADTRQTSSIQSAVNSTTAGIVTSTTPDTVSSTETDVSSSASASGDQASTTDGADSGDTKTAAAPHAPTSTPSQTAAAGSPPPLTSSQTAGVAVGATTGLLIAVIAAIFIARRYHAAKHGKRMSTGSVYPKVAYLYDPKTGGNGGDAEALMSGGTGGVPPTGSAARTAQGSPKHMQRHSTGTMPANRFTSYGNPFRESIQDPAVHRYSEYARLDTARALSAAVAGYGGAPTHSSSYTKYPSDVTNPFSDHMIPSPTFAPFSPDDIRRPELLTPRSVNDRGGDYSQMPISPYAYLNTAASMYPPISPYGRPPTQGSSPTYDTTASDHFADPFEHDLLLQVDERNRTSDSVTIFAPSPNLKTPRTPRTPVGPKLPVRQPNDMTSARSLLSPVAAKYMHKAQEVKIPRKSVASPVLVQVGRSPVIKPFSPPPAAPEPIGWDDIKRHSEKRFSDEQSVPAPLNFASSVIKKNPVPTSHARAKPSLTGAGRALLAGNGLPLTVNIPHMHKKSVGLDVPKVNERMVPAHEDVSSDPVVREKRSRELRFADPSLIGKAF